MRTLCVTVSTVALLAVSAIGVTAQDDPTDRPPVPSAGCGVADVEAGEHYGTMQVGDSPRSWVLHVPPAHDGDSPVPLVLLFHGYADSPNHIERQTGFGGYGAQEGLVVVAPAGRGTLPHWMEEDFGGGFFDATRSNPDVVFIEALLDRLAEELCLDLARVYATGFSNGAGMTSVLACALEDRIAAVAPVGGLFDFGASCVLDRPVPFLGFHGTDDELLLYEGGFGVWVLAQRIGDVLWRDLPLMDDPVHFVPVPDRVAGIAARNGCEPGPTSESIAEDVERLTWTCPEGAEVALIAAHGDGHSWPGSAYTAADGEKTTMEIDANETIWDFFEQHPMPE